MDLDKTIELLKLGNTDRGYLMLIESSDFGFFIPIGGFEFED